MKLTMNSEVRNNFNEPPSLSSKAISIKNINRVKSTIKNKALVAETIKNL
jgi:hypothetical protein|tara:strand:+ start:231 stop:380 length:150 start_codon:yes stop_codon:yes gene_type:complete